MDVWVLGASGRAGAAIAVRLHGKDVPLVLVGRNRARLDAVAAGLDHKPRVLAASLEVALHELRSAEPSVVVNTVGPFTRTAPLVVAACPPGTHYVDLANEFAAAEFVLSRDEQAARARQTLVTGAGFGVLATESVVLRLCTGRPAAAEVRVDAAASVSTELGTIGAALAGTIVQTLSYGGRQVCHGRMTRTRVGSDLLRLTTPDGHTITTTSAATGELLAAWRASRAGSVIAASTGVPNGALIRGTMPAVTLLLRLPFLSRLATARIARRETRAQPRPRPCSWAHARVVWHSGEIREGWLSTGDGLDFTTAVAAEVTLRLARGQGRRGAFTPGALFGADLAETMGAELALSGR
ncbi:saccharopine dehydrogenase NADP-binding domain-containing protein [Actinoplanes sp. NPDC051861]|uniref:saccharopine dehydrogenase NADP-binding domain-containing protein n=1 Tax=Actinoplanes sp. NPDC051861 TaxID=3155170 RepID=UPI003435869C